jgi:ribosome-associated heat shock protein Hsp15
MRRRFRRWWRQRRRDGKNFTRGGSPTQSGVVENPPSVTNGPAAGGGAGAEDARLDKWLWAVRAYGTRALAAEACRQGRVSIDGRLAKPAAGVRPGQVVEARQGVVQRKWVVLAMPRGRQGAALVRFFAREETAPEAWAAAREQRVQHLLAGGGGRPDKRDRRLRQALRGEGREP